MSKRTEAVDIIIPVYNGYEDLQLCIPSVKKYTDLTKHRVILINDCSPDERIAPYLDGLAQENIVVLHNEKNLGFSANINKGMAQSANRDVLLLNSDTIVTEGWLEKIRACAYRDPAIGTVTPLSNSATLCSVPVMCQDNPLPEGFTVDEYAALIERCSLKRYPRITVAVGFCMFIKRCVIDDIGNFDAETFGRGYGEENDFCNRAEQAGYHHVMCDDTFVYHKGTASFDTEEKRALLEAHDAILKERYARQMENNHLYCMANPDQEIRDNLNMYTRLHNGRQNILYLLHLDFQGGAFNNIGGTQIHVKELVQAFRQEYNIFVAARDEEYLRVTAYTDQDVISLKFEIGEAPQFPVFRDAKLGKIYEQILMAFDIDLVHIQHSQDLSLELYYAAEKFGIPVIATIHDFYYACPTIILLDPDNQYCMPQEETLGTEACRQRCQECLRQKKEIASQVDYLRIWRKENEKALSLCRKLIFPSKSARDIMLHYFPSLKDKCMVIYHGEDKLERDIIHVPSPDKAQKNGKLHIRLDRVPGADQGLNDVKGWAYLEGVPNEETKIYVEFVDSKGKKDCFLANKVPRPDIVDAFGAPEALMCGIDLRISTRKIADGPVKIHVYVKHGGTVYTDGQSFKGEYRHRFGKRGRLNVAFLGGMVPQKGSLMARELIPMDKSSINWFVLGAIGDKRIMEISQDNCFFSSTYQKDELPQLLEDNEIDVVCILPIWPETFCYTVSEAWMNGIPVVGTDIGAVGERIRETGGGWLVKPDAEPEEVMQLLHHIMDHPGEYQEKKEIVEEMDLKSVEQMCDEYRSYYRELLEFTEKEFPEGEADFDFVFQGLALGDPTVSGRGTVAAMNRLKNENAALKASIEVTQGTISYQMARKISDAKIPFKNQIKKVLRRR
ncbi:MAG: glycosyltransferase [Hominisplanchenecus sp.]